MQNTNRLSLLLCALCVVMGAGFAATLLVPTPAHATADPQYRFYMQQTINGKTYGFCFSSITVKARSGTQRDVAQNCAGSFQSSTSMPGDISIAVTLSGPITVTCPNGQVAATTLGGNGVVYLLLPPASPTTYAVNYKSPCNDGTIFSLQIHGVRDEYGWGFFAVMKPL